LDLLVNIDKNVVKNTLSSYEDEKNYKGGSTKKILNELEEYSSETGNYLENLKE
jgi:hypothetical protein